MNQNISKKSQLLTVLEEGVGLVQMILFKELRNLFKQKYSDKDIIFNSMLAGAVTNELFGSHNPEKKFQIFRDENMALINRELNGLSLELPDLKQNITDALRIQTLCDNQQGFDSAARLTKADELGILDKDREIPLPSTFMTMVRELGEQHGLIIPPVLISPDQDISVVH